MVFKIIIYFSSKKYNTEFYIILKFTSTLLIFIEAEPGYSCHKFMYMIINICILKYTIL